MVMFLVKKVLNARGVRAAGWRAGEGLERNNAPIIRRGWNPGTRFAIDAAKECPMIQIARLDTSHPDRSIELQEALARQVSEMLAQVNDAGYSSEEGLDALAEVVENARRALYVDPDPADDPS